MIIVHMSGCPHAILDAAQDSHVSMRRKLKSPAKETVMEVSDEEDTDAHHKVWQEAL